MDTALAQALGEISTKLGDINGKLTLHLESFKQHIADDNAVEVRVRDVELTLAKQRGSARVWGLIGNGASAILGAAAAYFGAKHV